MSDFISNPSATLVGPLSDRFTPDAGADPLKQMRSSHFNALRSALLDCKADLAPKASPTFTGTPLSTTAAADTNTTQIATTAYVVGQGYAKLASADFTTLKRGGSDAWTAATLPVTVASNRLGVYGGGGLGGTLEVGAGTAGVNIDLLLNGGSDSGKGPAIAFYRGGSVKGYVGTHSYILGGTSDAAMLYGASTVELGVGGAVIGTVTSTGLNVTGAGSFTTTGGDATVTVARTGYAVVATYAGGAEGSIGTTSNHPFQVISNNAAVGVFSSTGLDVTTGALSVGGKAISFGAADSAGAGYRTMKIAN